MYLARRAGNREYGVLAHNYTRSFEAKWLRSGQHMDEPFLGSEDVRALADLGRSMETVEDMRPLPVTRESMVMVALATLAPIAPLLLAATPTDSLMERLLGVLF